MGRRKGKNCFFNTQKVLCPRCFRFQEKMGAASVLFWEKMEGGLNFLDFLLLLYVNLKLV